MKYIQLTIFILLICIFLPSEAKAAIYYVSPNGTGNGTSCVNAKTLSWFNTNAQPGDTANLCAGSYKTTINPANNGTSLSRITYQIDPVAAEWSVIVTGVAYGFNLTLKNYIKISGIFFNDVGSRWGIISGNYNWVAGCRFYDSGSGYSGLVIDQNARFNRIEGSTFDDAPPMVNLNGICEKYDDNGVCTRWWYWDSACQAAYDANQAVPSNCNVLTSPSDMIRVTGGGTTFGNAIINNTFGNSDHEAVDVAPSYPNTDAFTVIRGNTSTNEFHSAFSCNSRTLLSENTAINMGAGKGKNPYKRSRDQKGAGAALYVIGKRNLVRFNKVINSDFGLYFGAKGSTLFFQSVDLRIYHNSLYNNPVNVLATSNSVGPYYGNKLINNIFLHDASIRINNADVFNGMNAIFVNYADGNYLSQISNTYANNSWPLNEDTFYFKNITRYGTPKCLEMGGSGSCAGGYVETAYPAEWFASNFYADPNWKDPRNGDLHLTAQSTAMIDKAAWLSKITSTSGSGMQVKVDDPLSFYDGWGISGEVGDMIYTSAKQSARIKNVDYSTGVIQLDSSITWKQGDGVTVVNYSGTAPDMGAFEYVGSTPTYITGDLNKDNKVDIADYSMFIQDFGKTGANLPADLNKNGQVEIGDYSIFISNFGKTS